MATNASPSSSAASIHSQDGDEIRQHDANGPGSAPGSGTATPRLTGRRRLMKSLQRISSSPSMSRFRSSSGASSSGYRGGQASMSCISFSSASPHGTALGTSFGSAVSNGYSTAPTSVPSTPGEPASSSSRVRFVQSASASTSRFKIAPLPADVKLSRPGTASGIPSSVSPVAEEDYFSRPVVAQSARRKAVDFWGDMPLEIKMHILRMLPPRDIVRCSRVSRAWHRTCFDGQLWANMDTTDFYSEIPPQPLVKIIKQAGPFVRDLNLRGCIQLRDTWRISNLPDVCQNLENLSLEGCFIDRATLHSFLYQNPRLVHLNLSGLSFTSVNNSTMGVIASSCPRLELLNVAWCKNVDTKGLLKVIKACGSLRDLRASEVAGFDSTEFMLEMFCQNTLERLVLINCDSLTNESLAAMVEGADHEIDFLTGRPIVPPRNLRHLDLSRCRNVGDAGISALVGNVPFLEGLQLARCRTITDAALTALLPTVPLLTHLDLEELEAITNHTLQALAAAPCAPAMQHLSISYCETLGDAGMLPVIKACPALRNLDLDNTRISDLVLAEAAAMVRQRSPPAAISAAPLASRPRAITWDGASAPSAAPPASPACPKVGLRMVVYDCQNVTWTGIREVLSRNAEIRRPSPPAFFLPSFAPATTATTHSQARANTALGDDAALAHAQAQHSQVVPRAASPRGAGSGPAAALAPSHPHQIISLKVFYGYQPTVTEHTRRVLRGDLASASRLERKWAEYMMASEEAGAAMGVGTGNGLGRLGAANGLGNAALGLGVLGNRRRRRRVREAQLVHADEEEGGGPGGAGAAGPGPRRRRTRSSGGCAMM